MLRTPLYHQHVAHQAKLVDFAGWEMPISYGSQIEEHHQVRKHAGMFDVSHMGVLDVDGEQATEFLRFALANDVQKLKEPGRALYTCLLNERGGVIDDLIVYRLGERAYRIILNASRREADTTWLTALANDYAVTLTPREDYAIMAVQGPKALEIAKTVLPEAWEPILSELKPFRTHIIDQLQVARTGYTGEDGIEMVMPGDDIAAIWEAFAKAGVKPCGLGARDTLRLEAGLNLYGNDMTEDTSPLISNLSWTIDWKDEHRDFVGKQALLHEKEAGVKQKLVGLVMTEKGVLRDHQHVHFSDNKVGEITSGSFSPTLGCSIALVRIPADATGDVHVERRGKTVAVDIVKPPFVRHGEKVF